MREICMDRAVNRKFYLIISKEDLEEAKKVLNSEEYIGVDIETTGLDPVKNKIVITALVGLEKGFIYTSYHRNAVYTVVPFEIFDGIVAKKVAWNAKFERKFLHQTIPDLIIHEDSMFLGHFLDVNQATSLNLGDTAEKYLGVGKIGNDVFKADVKAGKAAIMNLTQLAHYCGVDAALALDIFLKYKSHDFVPSVLYRVEKEFVNVMEEMELTGITLDTVKLEGERKKAEVYLSEIGSRIRKDLGPIEINSNRQLSESLIRAGVPLERMTPGGKDYSVKAEVLDDLKEFYPIVAEVKEFKTVQKLLSLYFNSLPTYVRSDGRIHCSFFQVGVPSGRTACADPNLQQVSKRVEVRSAFVAAQGHYLLAADYCLHRRTRVLMANGRRKTISSLVNNRAEENVLAVKDGKVGVFPIVNWFKHKKSKDWLRFSVRGERGCLVCSRNHQVYTSEGRKKAAEVKVGDKVTLRVKALGTAREEVLFGTLMGDSCISRSYLRCRVTLVQSYKQKEYFEYKRKIFEPWLGKVSESWRATNYTKGAPYGLLTVRTIQPVVLNEIGRVCLKEGKKRLNQEWADRMSWRSLSFWYLDDGGLEKGRRLGGKQRPRITSEAVRYAPEVVSNLLGKFGLKVTLSEKYMSIRVLSASADRFFEGICRYVPKCMERKLPEEYRGRFEDSYEDEGLCYGEVVQIDNKATESYQYDIEVGEAHNYFAGDFLVSNSQIEARVFMALSGDGALFAEGLDIHSLVASYGLRKNINEVTKAERSHFKTITFGIMYGMEDYGLAKRLKISLEEARSLMEAYFSVVRGGRALISNIHKMAKQKGYACTPHGRKRYMPELASRDRRIFNSGCRGSVSHEIQGGAADIVKVGVIRAFRVVKEKAPEVKFLLLVHDEIVMEVPESVDKADLKSWIKSGAEVNFRGVKMEIATKWGRNWGEMTSF